MNIDTLRNAINDASETNTNKLVEELAECALKDRTSEEDFGIWAASWSHAARYHEDATRYLARALVQAILSDDDRYEIYQYLRAAVSDAKNKFGFIKGGEEAPYGLMKYIAIMGMSLMSELGLYVRWSQNVSREYKGDGYFNDYMDVIVYVNILKFIGGDDRGLYIEGDDLVADMFKRMYNNEMSLEEATNYLIAELKKGNAHEALNMFVNARYFEYTFNNQVIGGIFNLYFRYDPVVVKGWRGYGVDEFYSAHQNDLMRAVVHDGQNTIDYIAEEVEDHIRMMVLALYNVVQLCDK